MRILFIVLTFILVVSAVTSANGADTNTVSSTVVTNNTPPTAVGGVLLVTTVEETVFVSAPLALVTALTTKIKVKTIKSILIIYRP